MQWTLTPSSIEKSGCKTCTNSVQHIFHGRWKNSPSLIKGNVYDAIYVWKVKTYPFDAFLGHRCVASHVASDPPPPPPPPITNSMDLAYWCSRGFYPNRRHRSCGTHTWKDHQHLRRKRTLVPLMMPPPPPPHPPPMQHAQNFIVFYLSKECKQWFWHMLHQKIVILSLRIFNVGLD